MRFLKIIALFCLLPAALSAGNFEVSASADKTELELGETFSLHVILKMDGNFAFAPQLAAPAMDGFQLQSQPQQSQNVTWVNGVVTAQINVQWDLAAMKSGTLSVGPFKVSANDASAGTIVKTAPAIIFHVAKPKGFVLPPTPTPDSGNGAPASQADQETLRDIKADLGPPWARIALLAGAALALAAGILWFAYKPKKPKKIPVVRDPGQVALLDLEKAREILLRGDEEAYSLELARIIRFYLRHRLRTPDKEITLLEAERLVQRALGSQDEADLEAIERLQELLFGGMRFQPKDGDGLQPGLRALILKLEKGASWRPSEIAKAELERLREIHAAKGGEAYYSALGRCFRDHLSLLEERLGSEALQGKIAQGLEALGPAAAARVKAVLLSKRLPEELDCDKLCKDLQRLADALEGSPKDGK